MKIADEKAYIQECMVCGYKCLWYPKSKEEVDIIRAACLPCGHQGLFTLEETDEDSR